MKMKKIELHVHFESFANPQPTDESPPTPERLHQLSTALGRELVRDGVIYAEVRLCPFLYAQKGLSADQVVREVLAGFARVPQVKVNLVLCMMREMSDLANARIANLAKSFLSKGVCGLDLTGDESARPNYRFDELFAYVRELEVPFTIHAGETGDASNVMDAIRFGAQRIGHGARAAEDDYVLRRLLVRHIPLELCVTSDLALKTFRSYADHPVRQLFDLDIPITISTNRRDPSHPTLEQEYQTLREYFGFSDWQLLQCNLTAAATSFVSPTEKDSLRNELLADFAKHQPQASISG